MSKTTYNKSTNKFLNMLTLKMKIIAQILSINAFWMALQKGENSNRCCSSEECN